ncbi:MAG TPA: Ig-like domain-containing protein, partial [Pirellulaceae bacterium]|nr:Ig-like domain-containing protein [Pirellulaceae bacterium]
NLTGVPTVNDVAVHVENARYNSAAQHYVAELRLQNQGDSLGRSIAVAFPGLPDGVTLRNPSGTTADGDPYINFAPAITRGGLSKNSRSERLLVEFDNPAGALFTLAPEIFAGANQPPVLAAIDPLTVMPGGVLSTQLSATDPDGDIVTFSLGAAGSASASSLNLPTGILRGNGTLEFKPEPDQLGQYTFDVIASDGVLQTRRTVTLDVIADPLTTTRVSGFVLDVDQSPLAGLQVEIGGVQGLTMADGSFTLDLGSGPIVGDTLKIRGETFPGPLVYPFIAEKLPFILEHEVFLGVNNVIERPIFLPPLDIANGMTIDPMQDTNVTTAAIPGTSVFVAAGTLMNQQGTPFTGVLSITEVPRELTPAALPDTLFPDLVVTIQPGEMVFATPAPMTFPNRAGWAPGTLMDLWSINPVTGEFDDVGDMQVSADSTTIETISGGVRNSSWHFSTPTPENLDDETQEPECACPKPTVIVGSEAELGSGAYLEEHPTATYQSLGETRGVTLRYDSARANPVSILRFSYDVTSRFTRNGTTPGAPLMMAKATFNGSGIAFESRGIGANNLGFSGSENFWALEGLQAGQRTGAALPINFKDVPTGFYQYQLDSGIYQRNGNTFAGSSASVDGGVTSVNLIDSPFGSGWSIAGLQQVFEDTSSLTGRFANSVLLVDGDGTELLFRIDFESEEPRYISPPGDFSSLEKLGDGTFRRTMTNGMVYQFDSDGKLSTVTDRNRNEIRYEYDGVGNIERIIDPVGLEITFTYVNGRVAEIEDPAGRKTLLAYDDAGNLQQITDPDAATRTFGYDVDHLLRSETNKRGHTETVDYDSAGRVVSGVRADGSRVQLRAAQSQGLFDSARTTNLDGLPLAVADFDPSASVVDGNGRVMNYELTPSGLARSASDSLGQRYALERDARNRVTAIIDGNGDRHHYTHDDRGNVVSVTDEIVGLALTSQAILFPTPQFSVGGRPRAVVLAKIDRDENLDIVTANEDTNDVSVLFGDGAGMFTDAISFSVGEVPTALLTADLNGDRSE